MGTKVFKMQRKFAKLGAVLMMSIMMMLSTLTVFADTNVEATVDEQARRDLTNYVYSEMSENKYEVNGGGYKSGSDLFDGNDTDGYDLVEDEFNTLTSSAQAEVVSDIAENSNKAEKEEENVTQSTVQGWWKELQSKNGVGSKFMNEILKNTKPDFVTANAIYQPFSGLVGTLLGLGAVLIMAFLGLVIVCDICYICLPPVRNFVEDSDGGHKLAKSKVFSHAALYAVEEAENSDSGKQALGIYLRKSIGKLILLGICLMYLIQGQLYVLVGWILDLLRGFLTF